MARKPGDPRRAAGSGSVSYEHARGRWVAQLKVDGKRHRRTATDEDTARARLAKLISDHGQGLSLRGQYTVAVYLEEYLSTARVRANTRNVYRAYARRYIVPALGPGRLDRLTAPPVRRLLHDLGERGLSPRTVRQVRAILSGMLQQALADGLVERNVARLVKAPQIPNVERATLPLDEARALREAVRGDPLEALYVLAMTLGFRLGELRGLRWSDVDLEAGVLRVEQTAQWVKPKGEPGSWVYGPPKTPRSRRTLSLAPGLIDLLRAHRSRQAAAYVKSGLRSTRRLVFADAAGGPLGYDWLHDDLVRRVTRLRRAVAVGQGLAAKSVPPARVGFQELRHVAASLMHEQGLTPRAVMDVLGHANIATTMNVYTHIPTADIARTLAGADGWLEPEVHPEVHPGTPAGGGSDGGSESGRVVSGPVAQR